MCMCMRVGVYACRAEWGDEILVEHLRTIGVRARVRVRVRVRVTSGVGLESGLGLGLGLG